MPALTDWTALPWASMWENSADDTYVLADSPSALEIVSHYARRYQIQCNTEETKKIKIFGPTTNFETNNFFFS